MLNLLQADAAHAWMFPWERETLLWIGAHANGWQDALFVSLSLLGEWSACWILTILALLLWGNKERKRLALRFACGMFLASVCVILPLRTLLPRDRPHQVIPQVAEKGTVLKGSSFPSGHAQSAWLAVLVFGSRRRWRLAALIPFALLMCYARLYCGMHYPLDVLVGGLIGVLTGALLLLQQRWGGAKAQPQSA